MPEVTLPVKIKARLEDFVQALKKIYGDGLISVILYGSGASGELPPGAPKLNVLVVLASVHLEELKKSSGLLKKFSLIAPLYLDQDYIHNSLDIFPIEFLDMRENYRLLYGKDVLADVVVDTRNLRFQCEQELKSRLLGLRQAYLVSYKDARAIKKALLAAFTSVLHLARNVLRLKGQNPPYKKHELLRHLAVEFHIDGQAWEKILALKLGLLSGNSQTISDLFSVFMEDLENLVNMVDMM